MGILMVLQVLVLALCILGVYCKESSQHIINVYTLDKGAMAVSNEFVFMSDDHVYVENYPLPFLHFARRANFSEYTFQLVQGRWNDYIKGYFPHGLDEPFVRSSFKSALGFNVLDGGLTFIGKSPLDSDKIINYIGSFLCSGIDRLLRNMVRLKVPSGNNIEYSADPMSYLCFDNLLRFLDLVAPNTKDMVNKMFDKLTFSASPFTLFEISQTKNDSSTLLKVRILFIISQENVSNIKLVPLLPSAQLRVYSKNMENYESSNIAQPVPVADILQKKLSPVNPLLEPITVYRHITGIDQELYAEYHLTVLNLASSPVTIWLQEFLPYFFKPYFHTLKISTHNAQDVRLAPIEVIYNNKSDCYFDLGSLVVLPNETMIISMNIEKTILPFEEFPHDSSRGFDLPQMIFFYQFADKELHMTYVPSIVTMMPQPDLSMPFNVHAISSVLVGIIYKLYVTIMDYL